MIEVALVFDVSGRVIHWHLPPGRSGGYIPDSRDLWEVLWENRHILGGVAHTHPWSGVPSPSHTDVTTFAGIEKALGKRLVWPVVTLNDVGYFQWVGPTDYRYGIIETPLGVERLTLTAEDLEQLRELSKEKEV